MYERHRSFKRIAGGCSRGPYALLLAAASKTAIRERNAPSLRCCRYPSEGACSVPLLGAGWEVVEGEAAGAAKGRKAKRDASGKPNKRGSKRRRK